MILWCTLDEWVTPPLPERGRTSRLQSINCRRDVLTSVPASIKTEGSCLHLYCGELYLGAFSGRRVGGTSGCNRSAPSPGKGAIGSKL